MNLPIDIPGPREPRRDRAQVDTPKPVPFVVPRFLTKPDPSEDTDEAVDLRPGQQLKEAQLPWTDGRADSAAERDSPAAASDGLVAEPATKPATEPGATAADSVIRDLLRKTKAADAKGSAPPPSSGPDAVFVVEHAATSGRQSTPTPVSVPDGRIDRIPPEDLPERLHVRVADDPIEALLADKFDTTRFGSNNLTLKTTINPPAGGDSREFGDNPTNLRLQWDDVEPMVLRTWEEACEVEFFAGSVLESWLEVGSHSVLVHFVIGEEMTIWKFTNAFRTAVEDAAELL